MWAFLVVNSFSCKKGDQKLSFEQIDGVFIKKQSNNITNNSLLYYDSGDPSKISFKVGSIILYKTEKGNYGKMLIKDVYPTNTYPGLKVAIVTYNHTDDSVLAENSDLALLVPNNRLDLEKGIISDQVYDFIWNSYAGKWALSTQPLTTYNLYSL